jgi:hypothetical protein
MLDVLIVAAAGAVVALAAARILLAHRPENVAFADAREERLTRRLAQAVGCPLEDALTAIQREVQIAPDQTDETLLKRARYHYQRGAPEKTCSVYRDRAKG